PNAPGIAELVRGTASFADIITHDRFSRVHVIAAGKVDGDVATLLDSSALPTTIEALTHSYDHVVIDAGAISDIAATHLVPLVSHLMLVAVDPVSPVARIVCDRLQDAGFGEVVVVAGTARAVAA